MSVFTGCQVESDDSGNSEPAARISYTVKFDTNGGEGKLPGDITATVGEEFTLPAAKLTKTGYDFKGWYATADGTGTTYETGAKAKDLSKENGATVTLYAKWVLQGSWSINYILNGGTNADENPESYNVETETITLKPAVKSGYIFDGWYKEDSFATQVPKITKGSTGNITLYAKWTKTYTVTFDANGGSGTIASITEVAGTEIELPENIFAKDGCIFTGWAISAGVGVSYSDKAKITVTGDITLYATWGMTAASAAEAIANLTEGGTHTVTVTGDVSADYLAEIADAIYNKNSSGAKIILDLSGATGLTEIPDFAFHKEERGNMYALVGIVLPQSVTSIGKSAFSWTKISEIVIPDSVTEIGISAFDTCEELKSVKIGSGVTKIGNLAFCRTALTSIEIPGSVTSVGTQIFQDCGSLKNVTIGKGLASISSSMFISCSALEEIVIPDGVKSIERCAFDSCEKLETITIPASVTLIEDYAFDCTSLANVYYGGTVAEWNALKDDGKISSTGNNALFNATIHCTDGDITPTTGE